MKKLLAASIFALALLFLAACGSGGSEETSGDGGSDNGSEGSSGDSKLAELQEAGTVTIGFANEEPYGYQGEDGELKGAAVDIATAVFAELGVDNVEGQLSDYGQLIPGVKAGKFDVITSGMAIKPDRCETLTSVNRK